MAPMAAPGEGALLYATPLAAQSPPQRAQRARRAAGLLALGPLLLALAWARVGLERALPGGRPVPLWGPGYRTYSLLGAALGRQYLAPAARDALCAALSAQAAREPGRTFLVGETG